MKSPLAARRMLAPASALLVTAVLGTVLLAAAPAHAQFQARTIRVSNGINQEHPVGNGVSKMAQCLAEKSGGKTKLQAFWGNALGGDMQSTSALRGGTLEMVITSTSPLVGMVPQLGVFDLPFLFNSEKEADVVLDGPFGQYMSELLLQKDLVNLSWWENGFRHLTNSRKPVRTATDMSGLKVRVMQNHIFLDSFKTLGATATPMAFGEVYNALESRAIDGQENPIVTIDTSKMYEVQKHLALTKHAYTPFLVLYSKKLWDGLSADEQKALVDCSIVGRDEQRKVSRDLSDTSLVKLKKEGMQVTEIAPAELEKMRAATASVYERSKSSIGQETMDKIQAVLKPLRGG
jgi:tripartite ATP-independent transporter DctP family solute receptor